MEVNRLVTKLSFSPILNFMDMIKFEHTVFALPFAYTGMLMAANGLPSFRDFILITIAFIAARTYAMTLNRILDLRFDSMNPRTKDRHLVTGRVSMSVAYGGVLVSLLALFITSYMLGEFILKLLPIALFFLTFYHVTKRFTYLSHFVLGFTDSLSSLGAWAAVRKSLFTAYDLPAWLLSFTVTFWIAGFDIIYQAQDIDFDRKMNLYSIPSRFGLRWALRVARICHILMVFGLFLLLFFLERRIPFLISLILTLALLLRQHTLISEKDLSKAGIAFFNMNAYISIVIFSGFVISIFGGNP